MLKRNITIGIVVLFFGIILSMFVLHTPVPNTTNEEEFNVKNMMEYISEFSENEHSVYDPENHEVVRQYLRDKLGEFIGSENVYEKDYPGSDTGDDIDYDIHNILGVIQGQNDTGILLVAHYDSRGHVGTSGQYGGSYGACDDGYGISVLLELARIFADRDLTNSIYILMTDGEETGLYGASMASQDTDLMSKVGFVINVEARGIKGPSIMFETSKNNSKVIDFYKNANMKVSYSLATAVYTVMPNSTDFTEFLAVDKQGLNFAVLDGLQYYHSPLDNYSNVNASSLQHYGEEIVPLVEEFTTNAQYDDINYFDDTHNQVFFTLFSNVFVPYSDTFANVWNILLFVIFFALAGFLFYKKEYSMKQILKSLLILFGIIVVVAIAGLYISKFIAFVSSEHWNLTYVRTKNTGIPPILILSAIAALLGLIYKKKITEKSTKYSVMIVGTFINLLLATVTGFVLSGASFLFMIPAFSGLVVLALTAFNKNNLINQIVLSILLVINILVLIPILHLLFLAITVGGLLAFCVILVFYMFYMIPGFFLQIEEKNV